MEREWLVQGRRVSQAEVALIDHWLQAYPLWNRTRLSRQLCEHWNWRNRAGRLKDMACRSLLLKLEERGFITLPPRRTASVNGRRNRQLREVECQTTPVECGLAQLQPLHLSPVDNSQDAALFRFLLARHHYLGYGNTVGENVKYVVRAQDDRPLAALLFGAAAWKCAARDAWIGWSASQRREHLLLVANNSRFLVAPWVRVPCLGSHVLGLAASRVVQDWQRKYGHGIELLETFVQGERFAGACYQAAGWRHVGRTTGRTRNDDRRAPPGLPKEIFVKPLRTGWKERLTA
jgi:Druantia protein DruA